MKKIITLFALTVSLFLTSESLSAQNSKLNRAEIEDKAKKEMVSLDEELDLTTEQEQFVFKQYYSYFTNYNKHLNQKIKDENYKKNKLKFDETLIAQMKKILNEEQFAKFEKLQKNKSQKEILK
ncbi:hypothetical protein [Mesonia mobilis]|uniref:LTXXQ motif family protein n=1 Tax=Mesonia mobilis TaxID=369791 RepID=A0ABQ3C1T0_9FLAO|nr:hypothetical protein [Mesonia mobilis]MBQ0738538.1 hypothetical protein [Aquimarina celericrescens]GGZ64662.1 hypothetical protein GCM10008088_27690 [Mesonia mobilis]